MKVHSKIMAVAIFAEVILISTGLALSFAMGSEALKQHGNMVLAVSAAGLPLLLACVEMMKIPSAIALYKARWLLKPFAAAMMIAGMIATFETATMAGSTWFRSLQFQITEAQAELSIMEERQASADLGQGEVEIAQTVVSEIKSQLAEVDPAERREQVRAGFAKEWDDQAANNERRAASDNAVIRREAERSQAGMPSRAQYIAQRMAEWEQSEGSTLRSSEAAVAALRAQLQEANDRLAEAQSAALNASEAQLTLGAEIDAQRRLVAELAGTSIIYDLASKYYAVPAIEVTEEQANRVTSIVIAGMAVAAAMSTSLAALLATHMADTKPPLTIAQAIRRYAVRRRWRRKQTIEVPVYKDRVIYKALPHPESIKSFDSSVWSDLLNRKEEKSDDNRNTA